MDNTIMRTMLFDFYGDLLTEKQRETIRLSCEEDLSLSEIAAQTGVSRQGVHDALHRGQEQLEDLESKLHVLERFEKTQEGLSSALELIRQIPGDKARQAEQCITALMRLDEEEENGL